MQGEDSVEYFLGLAPSGLLLLRGKHTVATYYWPRVSKLYYKGRYFMIRVADKNVSFFCKITLGHELIKTTLKEEVYNGSIL